MPKIEKAEKIETNESSDLAGLEIETLELNEFLDDSRFKEGNTIAKVMAASCTTCECCCSY